MCVDRHACYIQCVSTHTLATSESSPAEQIGQCEWGDPCEPSAHIHIHTQTYQSMHKYENVYDWYCIECVCNKAFCFEHHIVYNVLLCAPTFVLSITLYTMCACTHSCCVPLHTLALRPYTRLLPASRRQQSRYGSASAGPMRAHSHSDHAHATLQQGWREHEYPKWPAHW